MHDSAFVKLDPAIVTLLLRKLTASLVGSLVRLNDGRIGNIVMMNPNSPAHPLMRFGSEFVDLGEQPSLQLASIIR